MPNLFCNFAADENVMSIVIAGVTYTVILDDFITLDNWISYFNAKVSNQNIRIVNVPNPNTWENVLQFKVQVNGADVNSTLQGSAWNKLGVLINVSAVTHKGVRAFDFSGVQVLHVQFAGLQSINQPMISSTFQVPVNNGFGGLIMFSQWNEDNMNIYQSSTPNQFNQIQVNLFDQRGKPLRTIRGNRPSVGQQNLAWNAIISYHDQLPEMQ